MVSGKEIRRKVVKSIGFVLFGFGIMGIFGTILIGNLVGVVISIVLISVGFVLFYTARPYEQQKQHREEEENRRGYDRCGDIIEENFKFQCLGNQTE